MYALKISYKMAIDGEYKRPTPIPDPFGQYFHQRGASVSHNTIRIRDLEFTDNHLINIINLIYYVKKIGYNNLSLSLDDGDSYSAIKDRFYLISSLPEVITKIHELKNGQKTLSVSYKENYDSLGAAELDGMSHDDIGKMLDGIAKGTDIDITIPDEIIKKYESLAPKISPEDLDKAKKQMKEAANKFNALLEDEK